MPVTLRWRQALNDLVYVEFDNAAATTFDLAGVAGHVLRIKMMKLAAYGAATEATVTVQSWNGAVGTLDWDILVHKVEGSLWSPIWKSYFDSVVGEGIRLSIATTNVSGWIAYEKVLSAEA